MVSGSGMEGKTSKWGVEGMERKIRLSVEAFVNVFHYAVDSVGRDGIGGDLFTVEVGEGSICGAEGSDVFFNVCSVFSILVVDQVSDERVDLISSFGDWCVGCGIGEVEIVSTYDLSRMEASRDIFEARGRNSSVRENEVIRG